MKNPYKDIIDLPNHKSSKYPHMPRYNRSAQFAPFMALTGYESVIVETARLTDEKIELDEYIKEMINEVLCKIKENIYENPEVVITYFKKDKIKSGGTYITSTGYIKKINEYEGIILMQDNRKISINDILEINSEVFNALEI